MSVWRWGWSAQVATTVDNRTNNNSNGHDDDDDDFKKHYRINKGSPTNKYLSHY